MLCHRSQGVDVKALLYVRSQQAVDVDSLRRSFEYHMMDDHCCPVVALHVNTRWRWARSYTSMLIRGPSGHGIWFGHMLYYMWSWIEVDLMQNKPKSWIWVQRQKPLAFNIFVFCFVCVKPGYCLFISFLDSELTRSPPVVCVSLLVSPDNTRQSSKCWKVSYIWRIYIKKSGRGFSAFDVQLLFLPLQTEYCDERLREGAKWQCLLMIHLDLYLIINM